MNFSNFHQQRKLIIIAASIGIVSIFLPWVSSFISMNGFSSIYGILTFICFIACFAIALIGNQSEPLPKQNLFLELGAGGGAILLSSITLFSLLSHIVMNPGIGVILSFFASGGILAAAWFLKRPEDSIEGSLNALKNGLASMTSSTVSASNIVSKENNPLEEIEKLFQMKEKGIISEEDFKMMKSKLLNNS